MTVSVCARKLMKPAQAGYRPEVLRCFSAVARYPVLLRPGFWESSDLIVLP
jgi:hypothetical protein